MFLGSPVSSMAAGRAMAERVSIKLSHLLNIKGGGHQLVGRGLTGLRENRLLSRGIASSYAYFPTNQLTLELDHGSCSSNPSGRLELPIPGTHGRGTLCTSQIVPFLHTGLRDLAVGLSRKMKNGGSFRTLVSQSLEQQPIVPNALDDQLAGSACALQKQAAALEEAQSCKDAAMVIEPPSPNVQAWPSSESSDSASELSSLSDSDTDFEHDKAELFSPSVLMGENVEALEASLRHLEQSTDAQDLRIGGICLRLAQLCDSLNEDPTKVLSYGQRALQILGSPEVSSESAMCHHVIGCAYHKMDEQEKAIDELERSAMIIEKLGPSKEMEVGALKYAVNFLLGHIKMSLGRHDEALLNFRQGLAVNEKVLEPGNPDLGMSYQQAAEAYMEAGEPEEALILLKKALPVFTNYYGSKSSQVATLRSLMSAVYNQLEEYEKVLSENKMVRPILKSLGKSKEVASLDVASAEALIALEEYEKAIAKLKTVVNETGETSYSSQHALVLIAKAYAILEEAKDAEKYCKKAYNALKSHETKIEVGARMVELAAVYRKLNELDQSMEILNRALGVFEKHPEQRAAIADVEGQIGLLFLLMHKPMQGLPYLEKSAAKLESIYGLEDEELLPVYNHIAIANLEIGKLDEAIAKFEMAKKISVENHGPNDPDTIAIFKNLASTYTAVSRFDQAIECQKQIVDAVEGSEDYEEAKNMLEDLLSKRKVSARNQAKVSSS